MRLIISFLAKLLSFVMTFSLIGGCQQQEKMEKIEVQVMVPKKTNRGTPFYLLAKETTVKDFYIADYQTVADQNNFDSEDQSKAKQVLIPGTINTVHLKKNNANQPIGIYFLFTNPTEEWKLILENPAHHHYKILLSENGIESNYGY